MLQNTVLKHHNVSLLQFRQPAGQLFHFQLMLLFFFSPCPASFNRVAFFPFQWLGCFLEQNSMHCNVYLPVDSKNLIYWEHTELLLLQFWMLSLLKFVSNLKSGFVSRWRMRGGNLWKWERYFESKSFQNTVGLNSTLSIRWGNQLNHKQIIGGLPYERALQCRLGEGGPRSEPGGGL